MINDPDLQALRQSAQNRDWTTSQDTLKRLLARMEPLVALGIAAPQVQAFLPTFESYYPEATWVRELLLTVIAYASAPKDLPVHTIHQFTEPGCGNFLLAVFDTARTVQPEYSHFERYSHITNAVANAILADLQHQYYRVHPDDFARLRDPDTPPDVAAGIQIAFWQAVAGQDTTLWLHIADAIENQLYL